MGKARSAPGTARHGRRWGVVLAAAALAACAGPRESGRHVVLDPMHVASLEVDGERTVEVLDPALLFREAGRAFERGDHLTAARKYRLILQHFPESRYAVASRYNAGLALERAGRCVDARPFYVDVARRHAGSKDAHDALFRLATCHEVVGDLDEAVATFDRILRPEYPEILAVDRLEALARRGLVRQGQGDLALAERDYKSALILYRKHLDDRSLVGNAHVSVAQFQIGEIYRELFGAIRFRLPLETMARDLEDKSNLFLKAQNAYLKTVRLHHPAHAVAGGYRLGALYEAFYDDMLTAEIPSDLSREEVEVYYEELKKKIRPLIVQAIDIYERNLRLGQRFGQSDEWVKRTEASLARLKEILRDDSSRDALAGTR